MILFQGGKMKGRLGSLRRPRAGCDSRGEILLLMRPPASTKAVPRPSAGESECVAPVRTGARLTRENDRLGRGLLGEGSMEHIDTVRFCEVDRCIGIASWRLSIWPQTVSLCPRHTLQTMKNRRLWGRTPGRLAGSRSNRN
jgi:hypothetical protein